MDKVDYDKLNKLRCLEFDNLEVNWLGEGGIPIYINLLIKLIKSITFKIND